MEQEIEGQHVFEMIQLRQGVSQLEMSEAERRQTENVLERRVAELSMVNAIAMIVNDSLDTREILSRTMEQVLRLAGVGAAAMMLLDEEAGELVMISHQGLSDGLVQSASRLKVGAGLGGGPLRRAGLPSWVIWRSILARCGRML
jgi:hypothetical protein